MSAQFSECSRRSCGWVGTDDQKGQRRESRDSYTLICPQCGCDSFYDEKPLFIPLKATFFHQFRRGEKDTEYRPRGSRWNAKTCRIGRAVTLALGYSSGQRLKGTIVGFSYDTVPSKLPGWTECYPGYKGDASCIKIKLEVAS